MKTRTIARIMKKDGGVITVVLDPSGSTKTTDKVMVQKTITDPMVMECIKMGGIAIRYPDERDKVKIHFPASVILPIGDTPPLPPSVKWVLANEDIPRIDPPKEQQWIQTKF